MNAGAFFLYLKGKTMKKTYLGDSVYAEYNGRDLVLTTENGMDDDPSNRIILEPATLGALSVYLSVIASKVGKQDDGR